VIDTAAVLADYDRLRGSVPVVPPGVTAERDGPLVRMHGWPHGGFIEYSDLAGLEGAALDDLIERQVRIFAARGEPFEWKLHGHDLPRDLPDRLRSAGFVPEPQETLLAAHAAAIAADAVVPRGVALREVTTRADFERVAELEASIWGEEHRAGVGVTLASRRALDPHSLSVFVAEAGGEVVAAGWLRIRDETFALLQGGATLREWRGRGVYRALVARRAALAAARGCRYLLVDASDDSRPILERLGFAALTTTTPFMWSPPGSRLYHAGTGEGEQGRLA
jgi:GNAT superfamily N-acetyltransferase